MAQALGVVAGIIAPGSCATILDWAAVSYAETARVRSVLAARYAPNTANKCLAALRGTLKAAFRLGLIDADHLGRATDIRRVRGTRATKGRCLDEGEIARLLSACDHSTVLGSRNIALIAVGCGCGLRRAELVGLTMNDILDAGQALSVRGKGDKERLVYLPAWTQAHLIEWIGHRGDGRGPLFCRLTGETVIAQKLSEQTVYDVLAKVAQDAGISRVSPHDLRSYLPFLTMSGNARVFAGMIEIAEHIEKSLIRLPDIVFSELQTVEKSQ